ncbi:MAG: hypothetical protein CSA62_14065 [Planctomycetota bacterium]|nr:MAG: hypothetical protein CSA62_14065 [Planctomycetota bacterium]
MSAELLPQLPEQRSGLDRRRRATPMFSRYTFFGGRRRSARRSTEASGFVDAYGQLLFLVMVLIVALNALDAYFTMLYLGLGGEELNPLAQLLIDIGPVAFIGAKTIGIGICVAFLTMVKNFKGAKLGIGIVLAVYLLLLAWHFFLWFRLP